MGTSRSHASRTSSSSCDLVTRSVAGDREVTLNGTVFIGPGPNAVLAAAVARGGGVVVDDSRAARAIVWTGREPAAIAEHLRDGVEWVQLRQAGVERWLAAGLIDASRRWTSAGGVFGPLVAERAIAMLLAGIHRLHEHAHRTEWTKLQTSSVRGRTVVVVGAGSIGRHVALALEALGADAVGVSRTGTATPGFVAVEPFRAWPSICERADHLVLTAPSTELTRGMVDRDALARLGPGLRRRQRRTR